MEQKTVTTAQVTTLLNYWQKIIDHLWQAVETTIADLAATKQVSEERRAALGEALKLIDATDSRYALWSSLASGSSAEPPASMDDLRSPKEEVIQ